MLCGRNHLISLLEFLVKCTSILLYVGIIKLEKRVNILLLQILNLKRLFLIKTMLKDLLKNVYCRLAMQPCHQKNSYRKYIL
jgi:hypothetical protein